MTSGLYPQLVTRPQVAGVAVRAADTGRVLMLQRSIADEQDPARGKWEFPGGHIEPGETPLQGAVREWQEETGVPLPAGDIAGAWTSGPYVGHVWVIPSEDDVQLNVDGANRLIGNPDDPGGDDCEVLAWWAPSEAEQNPALRPEVRSADWGLIRQAVPDAVFKRDTPLVKAGYPQLVRSHVRGARLHEGVTAELDRYFQSNPASRACEAADHGYDPMMQPARYIAEELAEPAHASLRHTGPLTVQDILEWERQEDAEHAGGHVAKEQPTAGQVHVDSPSGEVAVDYTPAGKKKRRRPVDVVKADDEQRLVYGVVLEPDSEDRQGDVISKEDVELAAHRFLHATQRAGVQMGDQHRRLAPADVVPVESYIAPCDFQMGGQTVKKGSWVLVTHVNDDDLWGQVKKGMKAGYSVAGSGRRAAL